MYTLPRTMSGDRLLFPCLTGNRFDFRGDNTWVVDKYDMLPTLQNKFAACSEMMRVHVTQTAHNICFSTRGGGENKHTMISASDTSNREMNA